MRAVEEYGRVAVFCGGGSREREISLQSGAAVTEGLTSAGVDARLIDTAEGNIDFDSFDRVFIALHGRDGEDGKIQAVLDFYRIPYTGSPVSASALSMNKWYTKSVWESIGVMTPAYQIYGGEQSVDLDKIRLPVYVKPVNEGSSIGVAHVTEQNQLHDAVSAALQYDEHVLIEEAINGKEYSYSFIDGVSDMPVICLEPATDFYDYDAKYLRDDTRYVVDPPLGHELKDECIRNSITAYKSVGMRGWGRVDFMIDEEGHVWFIEVNSVPGMTSHSLVPMSASSVGLDFSATCIAILESSIS